MQEIIVFARIASSTEPGHLIWLPEKDQECPPFLPLLYLNIICTVYIPPCRKSFGQTKDCVQTNAQIKLTTDLPLTPFSKQHCSSYASRCGSGGLQNSSLLASWLPRGSLTQVCSWQILRFFPHSSVVNKERSRWLSLHFLPPARNNSAKAPRILSAASKLLQPPIIKI